MRGARYPGSFGGRAAGGWRWAVASRPLRAGTVPLSGDRWVIGPLSGASGWTLPVSTGRVPSVLSPASCGPSPLSSPGCPWSGLAALFRAFSGDPLTLFWATRTLWLPASSPALSRSDLPVLMIGPSPGPVPLFRATAGESRALFFPRATGILLPATSRLSNIRLVGLTTRPLAVLSTGLCPSQPYPNYESSRSVRKTQIWTHIWVHGS